MKTSEFRKVVAELKAHTVEVIPGLHVSPEMVGPHETVILDKRAWDKMQEMAKLLDIPPNPTGVPASAEHA